MAARSIGTLRLVVRVAAPRPADSGASMDTVIHNALKLPLEERELEAQVYRCTQDEAHAIVARFKEANGGRVGGVWEGPVQL